jgi:ketosteroid isomerase-like protein
MTDEHRNLDVVRQIGELWNADDFDGMLALYAEDVEVVTDPQWPEPPTRGKGDFARMSRDWREAWEKIEVDPGALQVVGPDRVLAEGVWHSRGAVSGLAGDLPFAILYTLRDGLVSRQQWFMDPSEARRVAGLG